MKSNQVLLGLDLGEKRVGLAVTDELGQMAFPLTTLDYQSQSDFIEKLKKVVEEYRVRKIIVGLPKTLKGEIGIAAKKIMKRVEGFRTMLNIEWELWDERLSTKESERVLLSADISRARRKEVQDRLAAQRILQSYLECRNKQGS
ncbi:MAG: Holliday junction resolvase RuvX [Candidatus Omnitrophica bacterium]|nr:Holliday junction resolvase RuvX [Candidatus Omnitrophota bacterium]